MENEDAIAEPPVSQSEEDDFDDAFVPCEICDTMVRFSEYASHLRFCVTHGLPPLQRPSHPPPLPPYLQPETWPSLGSNLDYSPLTTPFYRFRYDDETLGMIEIPIPMNILQTVSNAARMRSSGSNVEADGNDDENYDDEEENDDNDDINAEGYNGETLSNELLQIGRSVMPFTQLQLEIIQLTNPIALSTDDNYEFNMLLSEIIGKVEHGIEDVSKVTTLVDQSTLTQEDMCSICQESVSQVSEEDRREIVKTLCNHYFCLECLKPWLSKHRTCPLCMQNMLDMLQPNMSSSSNCESDSPT
jgi:hypothetical protein